MIAPRDRMAATRAVAYFLMVGGTVTEASALLVPGFAGDSPAGVLATAVVSGAMVLVGVLCRVRPQRIPDWFWVSVPLMGVGIIGFLNLITEDVRVSAHLFYLWPLVYVAVFLRPSMAYLVLGATCAVDAAVTFALLGFQHGVTDVASLITAYVVMTVVIMKLRGRADALVAMLEEQALSDPLTGLPNRRAFDRSLVAGLRRAEVETCLLIIDVDHFKTINDTWGHGTGDAVLIRVAAALRATAGRGDVVARIGGDEFAVVVNGDADYARRLAALLRTAVAAGSDLPDGLPTLSVGLASTQSGVREPETLLAAADRALYQAKLRGRDRLASMEEPARRYEPDPARRR